MEKETESYRNEIRKYEEILAKDPESFCFAPLSDVYRRMGRLDDALAVALKGCEKHPGYIGGYMALGRASFDMGLMEESRQALEKVLAAMPDNLLANQLLTRIYSSIGDGAAASGPDAVLRSLDEEGNGWTVSEAASYGGSWADEGSGGEAAEEPDDEEIIELLDVVFEDDEDVSAAFVHLGEPEAPSTEAEEDFSQVGSDLFGEEPVHPGGVMPEAPADEFLPAAAPPDAPEVPAMEPSSASNPLNTVTIAELYVSQGFSEKALSIYEELLASDPDNADLQSRIFSLKRDLEINRESEKESKIATEAGIGFAGAIAGEQAQPEERVIPDQAAVIDTLEGWLANIRRRR